MKVIFVLLIPLFVIGFILLSFVGILIGIVRAIFGGGQQSSAPPTIVQDDRVFDTDNAIIAETVDSDLANGSVYAGAAPLVAGMAIADVMSCDASDNFSDGSPCMPDLASMPVETSSYAPDPMTTPVEASFGSGSDAFGTTFDTTSSFSSGMDSPPSCGCHQEKTFENDC
jgi:hypothetical protein